MERPAGGGELERTRDARGACYLALAEQTEQALLDTCRRRWLERLEREQANLRAALQWLLERQGIEAALRLSGALRQFWFLRGDLSGGRSFVEQAIAASREDGPHGSAKVGGTAL